MINLNSLNKDEVFSEVDIFLGQNNISAAKIDKTRPWGGFFVVSDDSLEVFAQKFFPEVNISDKSLKLSPKILVVAPDKRLSWQYHFRRSEVWKLISGEAGIVRSETDEENELNEMQIGELITLKKGERHRLVGMKAWGVVAEIWQHADADHPSDEDDIVRLQDDFGR
jgi:mannose-6-phosphate isomerase